MRKFQIAPSSCTSTQGEVHTMATARPEVTGRRTAPSNSTADRPNSTGPPEERDAYSIPEFCRRHNISHGTYYNLKNRGLGPREARAMSRVIITKEAAADWRRARESIETPTST
jgi:hypothetical protein